MRAAVVAAKIQFQPTRPRGARPSHAHQVRATQHVSTQAPARGATAVRLRESEASAFQPTRPRGARLVAHAVVSRLPRFNPRAREGRDTGPLRMAAG